MAEPDLLAEHFREVSERLGKAFKPSEGMVRMLARYSLEQDTTAAIAFGEMRAELYPESFRARVFLGDVWADKGDVEKARGYYEQALAKSPDNAAIRKKLEELGA
jgi:tetratricopeptide (TPR) repeat protein